jgi:hypothetical protein
MAHNTVTQLQLETYCQSSFLSKLSLNLVKEHVNSVLNHNVEEFLVSIWNARVMFTSNVDGNIYTNDVGLGAFAASELDKVFSGYQPR